MTVLMYRSGYRRHQLWRRRERSLRRLRNTLRNSYWGFGKETLNE
jgi:hypothetical protein